LMLEISSTRSSMAVAAKAPAQVVLLIVAVLLAALNKIGVTASRSNRSRAACSGSHLRARARSVATAARKKYLEARGCLMSSGTSGFNGLFIASLAERTPRYRLGT